MEAGVDMKYTEESLTELCCSVLGKVDKYTPLPKLVEQAAVELFRINIECESLCGPLRMALCDLHVYGEFRFEANPELINPIQERAE